WVSRSDYWLRFVLPFTVIFVLVGMTAPIPYFLIATMPLVLAGFCMWLAVAAKRCHDRDRSAWFLLILLVPYLGQIWLLIELAFLRGTPGPNRFGSDPLAKAHAIDYVAS